jgi:hypothetical protein
MTPAAALTAVIGRMNAAGFTECVSPLGLRDGGTQRLDGGFAVRVSSYRFEPSRGASRVDGARMDMGIVIELGHLLKPGAGQEAPAAALAAVHLALRYLFTPDTALTATGQGSVLLGGITLNYDGGYLVHAIDLRVIFSLSLVAP